MLSIQAVRGLPRLHAPGIVPCIISFSRQLPCFLGMRLEHISLGMKERNRSNGCRTGLIPERVRVARHAHIQAERQRGRGEVRREDFAYRAALWSEFATHRLDSLSAPVLGQQPSCYFRSKRKDPSAKYETRKPVIENIERAF